MGTRKDIFLKTKNNGSVDKTAQQKIIKRDAFKLTSFKRVFFF